MVTTLNRTWQRLIRATPGESQADLAEKYPHFQAVLSAYHTFGLREKGAAPELQKIRARLLEAILNRLELSPQRKGDLIEARLAKYSPEQMADSLTRLGNLTLYINQLDISLVSDSMIDWYVEDFLGQ